MNISASVYIATSLDGFIAREDGAIDWLMEANATVPEGEDCGYVEFMKTIDVLIMGRNTYEQVAGFEPWPYAGKRVVVLTSRGISFPTDTGIQLEASAEPVSILLERLAKEGCRHAYVDGGKVIQSFFSAGLIDRITVTSIPVLLGSGRRLFGAIPRDISLSLESSKAYSFGFVQSTYLSKKMSGT
jgi:dihydrofolate reductase